MIRRKISPEARPYVHLFATSADILDTATALRFKALTENVIIPDLVALEEQLIALARAHAETVQIGRTHGQHAEPTTFGYALALYVSRWAPELKRSTERDKTFEVSSQERSVHSTD